MVYWTVRVPFVTLATPDTLTLTLWVPALELASLETFATVILSVAILPLNPVTALYEIVTSLAAGIWTKPLYVKLFAIVIVKFVESNVSGVIVQLNVTLPLKFLLFSEFIVSE